ncbi:MAG: immunoglobulin-like domain-containing protein, partial [Clostridia bacterium]
MEESGYYYLIFRYNSAENGKIRIYLDNTNLTLSGLTAEAEVRAGDSWNLTHAAVFLRQGINIVDIDSDRAVGLDYMRVVKADLDCSDTYEAENSGGNFETAVSGERVYVKEMDVNGQYLEFTAAVPADGTYKMQVFQSNNDLCGTHSYNIKIIDRYAVFEVNGESAGRYFFPNSFSDDTFLERTIPIELKAGENRIKVYNDDSWQVLWGGSKSEPGTNRLENFTPNFDKFVISPAAVETQLPNLDCSVEVSSTENGYAYSGKNTAAVGETVTIYLVPDGEVKALTVNGQDITASLETEDNAIYTVDIEITGDTNVFAEFSPAEEGDYEKIQFGDNGLVSYNGETYKVIGENLFTNGDFKDNSGAGMEQWYVGVNTGGHPTSADYRIPKINPDGSVENLVSLTDSGLLTTGTFEKDGEDTFYYGDNGKDNYLVEHMSSDWKNCAWNGSQSLLAFVPVKSAAKYYFKFSAYSSSGKASIRYGAVDMDEGEGFYVPSEYTTSGTLNFCGSGYVNCKNGDQQNVGGNSWKEYETVIDTGEGGDYFLFNAYWLQMASYLCLGDFELYELSGEPVTPIFRIDSPAVIFVSVGDAAVLAETVTAETAEGEIISLPVKWLNADAVNTDLPNVYIVTGYVELPDNLYYNGEPYVKQRVIVEGEASDEASVRADIALLSVPERVSSSLTLPAVGKYGSTIIWQSSDESVISTDGGVNRPK